MNEQLSIEGVEGAVFGKMSNDLIRSLLIGNDLHCRSCDANGTKTAIKVEPNISFICCEECKNTPNAHQKLKKLIQSCKFD